MNNLKKLAVSLTLAGIIMMGVSSAKAGLLMSDFAGDENQQCTTKNQDVKFDSGILMSGFVGILMSDLIDIISGKSSDQGCVQVNHGILMSD
ncbi:MAG: hypothetical protein R2747_24365 [Pyrinomonadaceae bacterium]